MSCLACAALTGQLPSVAWRLTALACGLATAVIARTTHRAPWIIVAAVFAAGAQLAATSTSPVDPEAQPWLVSGGELAASVLCSLALLALLRQQRQRPLRAS